MGRSLTPFPMSEQPSLDNARDTLVIELNTDQPVGTDAAGAARVSQYLHEVGEITGLARLTEPRQHLSPLYGLSGWVPLDNRSAVHLYAWDDRNPSFVSVDLATRTQFSERELIDHATTYFGADPANVVHKTMRRESNPAWRELAPTIYRQRLALRGTLDRPLPVEVMQNFLPALAEQLEMRVLAAPFTAGDTAWMHWETSGVLADTNNHLDLDIYTCRPFSPEAAADFTRTKLGVRELVYKNF